MLSFFAGIAEIIDCVLPFFDKDKENGKISFDWKIFLIVSSIIVVAAFILTFFVSYELGKNPLR